MLPELEPLRRGEDWHPVSVVRRLEPTDQPREALPRLLVAWGVFVGPARIAMALARLDTEFRRLEPKARIHAADPVLAPFAPQMAEAFDTLAGLRSELVKVRARAQNDGRQAGQGAVGLQQRDLSTLTRAFKAWVTLASLIERPSPAGMSRALRALERSPELAAARGWCQRLWPEGGGPDIAHDRELGRLVLRLADGRLGYDPGA